MDAATLTIGRNHDPSVRPQNADVLLRQGTPEQTRAGEAGARAPFIGESPEHLPTSYMLLISRIDNMMRKGQPEMEPVEELGRLLTEKIARMPVSTRRTLARLEEVQALEVDNPAALPRHLADRIQSGRDADKVMELLRSPAFAAMIKEESRTLTYGPRGLMHLS